MKIYKWLFNEIIKISTKHAVMLAFLIMLQNITKPLELLAYKNIVSVSMRKTLLAVGVLFGVYVLKEMAGNLANLETVKYNNIVQIHFLKGLYNKISHSNILLLNNAEYLLKVERARRFIESSCLNFYKVMIVLICEIIETLVSAIILARINVYFVIIFMVMSFINNCTLKWYNADLVRIHKEQDVNLRKQKYFSDLLQNKIYEKEIRINNLFPWLESKREFYFKSTEEAHKKFSTKWSKINFCIASTLYLVETGVLISEIFLLYKGLLSLGDMVALLTGQATIIGSVSKIINDLSIFKSQDYQAVNLYEIFFAEGSEEKESSKKGKDFLRLENVSFEYVDKKAIDNLSLELKKGEKIALVGSNGSGKSTLINLILGLYKPSSGTIITNSRLTAVFQDFAKFKDLLKVNISLEDITNNYNRIKMLDLLKQSFKDLNIFPLELDTMLSKEYGGIDISLGQWQKIALCRALYKDAEIVIFDEPTSSLDPVEEKKQFETAFKFLKDKTVIIITHRVGITNYADRIVFMEKGRIVEEGTQRQLLDRKGKFYDLYNSQRKWYQ